MSETISPTLDAHRRRGEVVDAFAAAWARGEPPAIEAHLQGPSADRAPLALELALVDLEQRARRGWVACAELYLHHFPDLATADAMLELIRREWELRGATQPEELRRELLSRFPALAAPIHALKAPTVAERSMPPGPTMPPATATVPQSQGEATELPAVPGYEVLAELGRGGMGVVYRARQLGTERVVALKMILSPAHAGPEERLRFRREGQALGGLAHPNIVTVYEVGEHQGLPFFSLELCDGGSLDQRLAEAPLSPGDAAKVVQQLAGGVDAAHAAGVIHRDLKPANVLLDRDGTPKVTDFGLARRLEEVGHTQTGAVMGTPSYMAPEQARGQKDVGPLADVYALGAILYECLTGRPPFRAASALDTLSQVLHEEPVPPTRLNRAVPRDLETITLKCLRKSPGERYGSARELGDDLGRWLTGRPILARPVGAVERTWKWVRRNPTEAALTSSVFVLLVAGVIGLGIGLGVVTAEQGRTTQALGEAETNLARARTAEGLATERLTVAEDNFRLARKAVDDTFGIARRHPLLRRSNMSKEQRALRRALLEKALPFYREFQAQRPGEKAINRDLWRQLSDVAYIQDELGHPAEALQSLRGAEKVIRQLAKDHPADQAYRADLARTLNDLGLVLRNVGRQDEARERFRECAQIIRRLARDEPNRVEHQDLLAQCLRNLGDAEQALDQHSDALHQYHEAIAICSRLIRAQPHSIDHVEALASGLSRLGSLLNDGGRVEEALRCHREAMRWLWELVETVPDDIDLQFRLANEQRRMCRALLRLGRYDAAVRVGFGAVQRCRWIARAHPDIVRHQMGLVSALLQLALALDDRYGPEEQLPFLLEAVTVGLRVIHLYPEVPDYLIALGDSLNQLGTVLDTLGRPEEALRANAESTRLVRRLVRLVPHVHAYKDHLARNFHNRGGLELRLARAAEAVRWYGEAVTLRRALATAHPNVPSYQRGLSKSLTELGEAQQHAGQTKEAIDSFTEAANRFRRLALDYPKLPEHQVSLCRALHYRAALQAKLKRPTEAVASYEELAVVSRRLVASYPQVQGYKRGLSASLNNLALVQQDLRQREAAVRTLMEVVELDRQLLRAAWDDGALRGRLAGTLFNLGNALRGAGRRDEALRCYSEACEALLRLVREYPRVEAYRQLLGIASSEKRELLRARSSSR